MRLMWKQFPVCDLEPFNPINQNLVAFPLNERNVTNFLADRQMLLSRENIKAIFAACNLSDQSLKGLMQLCNNQSYTDCYWIQFNPDERWSQLKLYGKMFSQEIADAALDGETITTPQHIVTAEHNLKGTRSKCFVMKDGKLYLRKRMPKENIRAELKASMMLEALNLPHVDYIAQSKGDHLYSLCELFTDENHELLHYRTIMSMFGETQMGVDTKAFQYFYEVNPIQTLQMIIFDCITRNIDRNRDNFGLIVSGGKVLGHAPLFDHDACFKANTKGHYFVTNSTFVQAMKWVRTQPLYAKAVLPFVKANYVKDATAEVCKLFCQQNNILYSTSLFQFQSVNPDGTMREFLDYLKAGNGVK